MRAPAALAALIAAAPLCAQEDADRLSERARQDREIVYFLNAPETHSFFLYHDYTETREGMDKYSVEEFARHHRILSRLFQFRFLLANAAAHQGEPACIGESQMPFGTVVDASQVALLDAPRLAVDEAGLCQ